MRIDRRRLLGLAAAALLAALAGCSSDPRAAPSYEDFASLPADTTPTTTTTTLLGRPIAPEAIGVELDPDGRPYDADGWPIDGRRASIEPLTTLVVPDGKIRTMGGEYATYEPEAHDPTVSFGSARKLAASVIWEEPPGDQDRQVLGIRLDVPDTEVARWRSFETAYGTDGGTGAVVSASAAASAAPVDESEEEMWDIIDDLEDSPVVVRDRDGEDGDDTIVFSNGYGDGGFPMSRGVDADGRTVSLVIWDTRFPWRVAIPDGTPPPDVTEREDQLRQCLGGDRGLIDPSGGKDPEGLRCADG